MSYIYGFALQEASLPFQSTDELVEVAGTILADQPGGEYPRLAEFIAGPALKPGYDYGDEFAFGLDLILDGLARAAAGVLSGAPRTRG